MCHVLLISVVGLEDKQRGLVIHLVYHTAGVTEQYVHGMQQTVHVTVLLLTEQKREIGGYLLDMNLINGVTTYLP